MSPPDHRGPLRVPVMGQPNHWSCGTTSLRAVLRYHGVHVPRARVDRACGLTNEGTDHAGLVRGALAVGARIFTKADGTLAELAWFAARRLPPIVGWWSMDDDAPAFDPRWTLEERSTRDSGHFSICRGVDDQRVWLMDPQWAGDRPVGNTAMPRRDFLRVWYDTDTKRYKAVRRWYAVVHFEAWTFAGQLGGTDHGRLG